MSNQNFGECGLSSAKPVLKLKSNARLSEKLVLVGTKFKAKANCSICKDNHSITKCTKFFKMSPLKRFSTVTRKCFRCLGSHHISSACTSKESCDWLLAIKVLHQIAEACKTSYPQVYDAIINNTYVEDIRTSEDSIDNAFILQPVDTEFSSNYYH